MNLTHNGNCLELLRALPDNSVDSIVTDPPYGLSFMGKKWDYDVPSVEIWQECLRVLKPGGHLLAFAGTRTQHRMAVRIEDAGFEIRDMIAWVYGTGFPKSLDVSKAIDKAAGAEREVLNTVTDRRGDGTVYGVGHSGNLTSNDPITPEAQQWQGWGTALKPALEPITVARKPLTGTVAANVLQHGTGAINIDSCRIPSDKPTGWGGNAAFKNTHAPSEYGGMPEGEARLAEGRWPANLIHDGSDEPVELLGVAARFFYCAKASGSDRNYGCDDLQHTTAADMTDRTADSAGMNSPRAGAGRTSGAKNNHPTVKPIQLMRYLCRLVTPPNGLILDPFTGSGSTGVAATLEGFNFIGAEMDEHNCHIANTRINYALRETGVNPMITLIEYDADSKPTGRRCRLPGVTREELPDLLMLYGILATLEGGQLRGYHPANWCFVYKSGMIGADCTDVELMELLS